MVRAFRSERRGMTVRRAGTKANAEKRSWICVFRRFRHRRRQLRCQPMSSQALRRLPVAPETDDALLARLSALFAETAADYDRSGAFPHENFAALHANG